MAPVAIADLIDPSSQKTSPVYSLELEGLDKLIEYQSNEGGLSNSTVSKVSLPAGAHFCYITQHKPEPEPTWYSVQSGPNSHVSLESGLVYTNHSCEPTLEFHMFSPNANGQYPRELPYPLPEGQPAPVPGKHGIAGELRVSSKRPLAAGDGISFFYPSTEWASAKPFDCLCGSPKSVCIGNAAGASSLPTAKLEEYFLSNHIRELLKQRDAGSKRA